MPTLADLSSASPQSPDDATLAGLSPAARAKYKAQLPEILRASRSAANARGMFYSGDAVDAETKAQEALLASLAGEDLGAQNTAAQNDASRQLEQKLADQQIQAGKRNALLGLVGSGVGAATTLGGLAYMNRGNTGGMNNIFYKDGQPVLFDPKTKTYTNISAAPTNVGGAALAGPGTAAVTPAGGVAGAAPAAVGPQSMSDSISEIGPSYAAPAAATGGIAGAASQPSMWTRATSAGGPLSAPMMAGGAVGGLAGLGALRASGVNSTNSNIGAGLGGLGAYGLYSAYGSGNPYLAGGAALAGTFGGGLLGNLFK